MEYQTFNETLFHSKSSVEKIDKEGDDNNEKQVKQEKP